MSTAIVTCYYPANYLLIVQDRRKILAESQWQGQTVIGVRSGFLQRSEQQEGTQDSTGEWFHHFKQICFAQILKMSLKSVINILKHFLKRYNWNNARNNQIIASAVNLWFRFHGISGQHAPALQSLWVLNNRTGSKDIDPVLPDFL